MKEKKSNQTKQLPICNHIHQYNVMVTKQCDESSIVHQKKHKILQIMNIIVNRWQSNIH